ncbi:MAG: YdbL family protein [Gammaproteobacteria bacterium]|nr:YdbL family protein [Gammaproteobacteria bacterium]
MGTRSLYLPMAMVLFLAGCVTINVYFPAAAVEEAADRLIQDVWGDDAAQPTPPPKASPQSSNANHMRALLEFLIPSAHAQANIDASTPAAQALKQRMATRHKSLSKFYASGAVGLTQDGFIAQRDKKAVPVRERKTVTSLVADENRDRKALYQEIARANGHPEWEADIRNTFAGRWVSRAKGGWWYQSGGGWKQK